MGLDTTPGYIEKVNRLDDKYVTPGNRVYVVGTQDGLFPDFGGHIKGEMGGVWNHPIKLLDDIFIGIVGNSGIEWLKANSFRRTHFIQNTTMNIRIGL